MAAVALMCRTQANEVRVASLHHSSEYVYWHPRQMCH
jgi:hypothetical protein